MAAAEVTMTQTVVMTAAVAVVPAVNRLILKDQTVMAVMMTMP